MEEGFLMRVSLAGLVVEVEVLNALLLQCFLENYIVAVSGWTLLDLTMEKLFCDLRDVDLGSLLLDLFIEHALEVVKGFLSSPQIILLTTTARVKVYICHNVVIKVSF